METEAAQQEGRGCGGSGKWCSELLFRAGILFSQLWGAPSSSQQSHSPIQCSQPLSGPVFHQWPVDAGQDRLSWVLFGCRLGFIASAPLQHLFLPCPDCFPLVLISDRLSAQGWLALALCAFENSVRMSSLTPRLPPEFYSFFKTLRGFSFEALLDLVNKKYSSPNNIWFSDKQQIIFSTNIPKRPMGIFIPIYLIEQSCSFFKYLLSIYPRIATTEYWD